MKPFLFTLLLLLPINAFAQHKFELKDASKYFDIKATVADCDDGFCRGKARFEFYKKGRSRPYQVIEHENTLVQLSDDGSVPVNVSLMYDVQSVVYVGDFNFDGMEDVAICSGEDGSYGGPSYRVYLSDRKAGRFVFNSSFTKLGQHLGMFEVDKKKKRLRLFDKSGCCWHVTEEYAVINNQPVKVFVEEEDATIPDETKVKITTKRLAAGKWTTSVKYVKRER